MQPGKNDTPSGGPSLLVRLRTDNARRFLALLILSVGTSLLMIDYVRLPSRSYEVGDVAEWDVRANTSFQYVDWEASLERERIAAESIQPVYDYDANKLPRLQERISRSFEIARSCHSEAVLAARVNAVVREAPEAPVQRADEVPAPEGADVASASEVSQADLSACAQTFLADLGVPLGADNLQRIIDARWSSDVEALSRELLGIAMHRYVVSDRLQLPLEGTPLTIVRVLQDGQDEIQISEHSSIKTPAEVRQLLSLYALERSGDNTTAEEMRASLALARAAIRPNFAYNQLITEERRRQKRALTPEVVVRVQRGTAIVREGDVITREQAEMLQALTDSRDGYGVLGMFFAMAAFCAMVFGSLYSFGVNSIKGFSTRPGEIEALAFLSLLMIFFSRLLVEVSGLLAAAGLGMSPAALWFALPLAGGAMLARLLIGAETALVWVLGVSAITGLMMDQQVLFSMFFAISGVTAATMVGQSNERAQVLKAGVQTGLINASAALLISLIRVHLGDSSALNASVALPLWDVGFAFLGGTASAFLVLGLVPLFEMVGFVTDFKMLELANLNHPLLRRLMLRAPGTYHHSMTVASLSEAAAESIGANALQTRVACYFHDIGKGLQPQFFIENQRGGPNPHDRLQPHQSARFIIDHVVDGAEIAEENNLPQCILDGIMMHHGTSLIKYFYAKALEEAEPGEVVDEADFRYPGIRPSTREAGIIFIADRVEAACRTIKVPTAHNFRKMIQKLVNDAITDGQLEECPLTVKELYTVVEVFTTTLQGIHHHRIEYPILPPKDTGRRKARAAIQKADEEHSSSAIITLEIHNPLRTDANPEG